MSSTSEKSNIHRPAGLLERYHITRQYLKLDSCVVVAGKFVSVHTPHARLTPEILYPAVAHALRVHAALSVRIEDERGSGREGPSFARMREVNVAGAVRFLGSEEEAADGKRDPEAALAKAVEAEFMDPIDASKGLPLWRIAVTADNVVVFAWHHAIGDGQSGLAVLRTLLSGLNQHPPQERPSGEESASDGTFTRVRPPGDVQLVPPIEQLTDLSVSVRTLLSVITGLLVPQGWLRRDIWTGHDVVNATCDVVATRVRIIALSPASAARLLLLSKSHGATLTSTLYVLAVSALGKLLSENDAPRQWKRLTTLVPTSLRALAHLPPSVMCESVSTYQRNEPLLPSGFSWARAAAYTKELHESIPKTRETIGSLKYLYGKYEDFFRGKLGKKRAGSFEISNVGVFQTNVEGESAIAENARWNIESAYFAQDDGVGGAALKINVAGSPNGGVNMCITWGDGAVDDVLADTFVDDLQSSIDKLVGDV